LTTTERPVRENVDAFIVYTMPPVYFIQFASIIGPVIYAGIVAADNVTTDDTIAVELLFQHPAYQQV